MTDLRLEVIEKRFRDVNRIIAISGGKGGIGKSVTASTLALVLKELGYRVGLFDLDFSSPAIHVILGAEEIYPEEDRGIIPPETCGVKFMSIVYYTHDHPLPIRGVDISNALIELLTITRWGSLDFLIIDMPPGMGDVTLDVIRLIKKIQFLIVATQSRVVLETVKKVIKMLKMLEIPMIGVIENIYPALPTYGETPRGRKGGVKTTPSPVVKNELKAFNLPLLGEIGFDKSLENSLGDVNRLLETDFAGYIRKIVLNSDEFGLKSDIRSNLK